MTMTRRDFLPVLMGAALSAYALPAFATADGPDFYRVANVAEWDKLNMRAGPAPSYRIIDRIPHDGTGIENLGGRVGNWVQVRYLGVVGWVHGAYLAEDAPELPPAQHYRVVGVAWSDVLNMRAGPSVQNVIIGAIPPDGTGIWHVGPCIGNWCKVGYRGTVGWVHMRYLAPQA